MRVSLFVTIFFLSSLTLKASGGPLFYLEAKQLIDNLKKADTPYRNQFEPWRLRAYTAMYEFVDYYKLDRRNVSLAYQIFERYHAIRPTEEHSRPPALAACLGLAIRFYQGDTKSLNEKLQKWFFGTSLREITQTELEVCSWLSWKTFFPTPIQYLDVFWEHIGTTDFIKDPNQKYLVRHLKRTSLQKAMTGVYEPNRGMRAYQIAINLIIDTVGELGGFMISESSRGFFHEKILTLLK